MKTLGEMRGIVVVPQRLGGRTVSQAEMDAAVSALRRLPAEDIALVASRGVKLNLLPTAGLEQGLLGATTIVQDVDGRWEPTNIRVAARAGLTGPQAIGEIVQHEVGHAVAVLRAQDRSEDAAIAYANRH